jgi:gas vesicle protein
MRVQTGETPSSVLAFAPKKGHTDANKVRPDTTIVADDAGHGIISLLQKAADMAKSDCDRAMDLAHKLSFQMRAVEERAREFEEEAKAAEERARQFEEEANYFRDRAARAEEWLLRIHTEVERTFFEKTNVNARA